MNKQQELPETLNVRTAVTDEAADALISAAAQARSPFAGKRAQVLHKQAQMLNITDFLLHSASYPVIDVRTPAEFLKGHIPGAINIPLFSNEERAVIGTLYKQQGQLAAVMKGLEMVGPRLTAYVSDVTAVAPGRKVLMHCWRGGMRSGSFAQLLRACGFEVSTLKGGYKAFRTYVISQFSRPVQVHALGGLTGSGKTEILYELVKEGQQVIDLEGLAAHLGSAFGSLGRLVQPTQENFENLLGLEFSRLNAELPVWLEDECINIGSVCLPQALWVQLKAALLFQVILPDELRKEHIMRQYGDLDRDFLKERFLRIEKRLGSELTLKAVTAVEEGRIFDALEIALAYYDKSYSKQLTKKDPLRLLQLKLHSLDFNNSARTLIDFAGQTTTVNLI